MGGIPSSSALRILGSVAQSQPSADAGPISRARPEAATEWRSMDSAPRDGTRILVATEDGAVSAAVWIASPLNSAGGAFQLASPWNADAGEAYWGDCGPAWLSPKHWIPLGALPEQPA